MTDKEMIDKAADEFPAEFGLRAFPGDKFLIHRGASFVSDRVFLYIAILDRDMQLWNLFSKGTPYELRREIVPL